MGADNSANTCRRITETVRDAGINGITLPRDEMIILTINRQNMNRLQVHYIRPNVYVCHMAHLPVLN